MSDRIELTGLRVMGRHGDLDGEREVDQPFVVDVVLYLDLAPAGASDDLADTVDYGVVAETVRAVVAGESHRLIEKVAQRVAESVLSHPRVERVEVTVHKPEAPIGVPFRDVRVIIER